MRLSAATVPTEAHDPRDGTLGWLDDKPDWVKALF
jgi:hypothetical protein